MIKSTTVIMTAAFIAAAVTILSAPAAPVEASPVAASVNAAMTSCAQRAWPYLRCVGTEFGSRHIRLVTTDRLNVEF
jgi:hypothetical protein